MRKYVVTLMLLTLSCAGFAQSLDGLFEEFRYEKDAVYVNMSPFLMKLAKIFVSKKDDSRIIKKVKAVRHLDLEDCKADVRDRFVQRADSFAPLGYDELLRVSDDDGKTRVLIKMKKETKRELLVMHWGEHDCMLAQVKGKIKKEDIDKIVNEYVKKKHGRL